MIYSFFVLLIGIYMGQELNLPSIKKLSSSFTKTDTLSNPPQHTNIDTPQINTQKSFIEYFFDFALNKQKE